MARDRRDELLDEVNSYGDDELVQVAWTEFADFKAPQPIRDDLRADLEAAERQLREEVVLSMEGRGRLRSFIFNKRLKDRR